MAEAAGELENKDHTMTKADLVEEVTRVTELPRKESEAVVETIFESIITALQSDDKIEIRGFGSFRTRERRGRSGRNPKTGAKVEVPPKKIPFFKPSKELKDYVNTLRMRPWRRWVQARRAGLSRMDYLWTPWRYRYIAEGVKAAGCIFCDALAANDDPATLIVFRGKKNFIILNRYPSTSGHVMVVPYAHVGDLAAADSDMLSEMMRARAARPDGTGRDLPSARLQPGHEFGPRVRAQASRAICTCMYCRAGRAT